MPRDGAIIFGDLIGKLSVLRVACDKCHRNGQYLVFRLIQTRGHTTPRSSIGSTRHHGGKKKEPRCSWVLGGELVATARQ